MEQSIGVDVGHGKLLFQDTDLSNFVLTSVVEDTCYWYACLIIQSSVFMAILYLG